MLDGSRDEYSYTDHRPQTTDASSRRQPVSGCQCRPAVVKALPGYLGRLGCARFSTTSATALPTCSSPPRRCFTSHPSIFSPTGTSNRLLPSRPCSCAHRPQSDIHRRHRSRKLDCTKYRYLQSNSIDTFTTISNTLLSLTHPTKQHC